MAVQKPTFSTRGRNTVSRSDSSSAGGGEFELKYHLDTTIAMPTEIFISNEYYYQNGENKGKPNVNIYPESCVKSDFNDDQHILYVLANSTSEACKYKYGVEVAIHIQA